MTSDLEKTVQRLADIEAIKQLKARYASACDDDYNPDKLASLFAEDAVWDGSILGYAEGRDGIREYFAAASGLVPFAVHQVSNPLIEIDSDRCRAVEMRMNVVGYESKHDHGDHRYHR